MTFQRVASLTSILLALGSTAALAAERPAAGFYGGVALREQGVQTSGMKLGIPANALSGFGRSLLLDEPAPRTTLYGGYRWANDLAVEAAVNATDPYALRPSGHPAHGVGVMPAAGSLGLTDAQARTWNLDLYTSWNFFRNFDVYGRLGYAQTDLAPTFAGANLLTSDNRRLRDGVNYGVGVRYNMTSALGLRLEYGRFGRFAGEAGASPLESDQVTVGLQFRF